MPAVTRVHHAAILLALTCFLNGCGGGADNTKAVIGFVIAHGGKVTIDGQSLEVKSLAELPEGRVKLQRIDLNERPVDDAAVEQLANVSSLQYLGLHSAPISDAACASIAKIKGLEELELSATDITDGGLEALGSLESLMKLHLHNTRVTRKAIDEFKQKVPGCTVLK